MSLAQMAGGMEMILNEAEIQVLATLYRAESENNPVDKFSLEESGKRYRN